MSHIPFHEFLEILAPRATLLDLQQPYAREHGVCEPEDKRQFVAPTLSGVTPVEKGRTSVILVSAPGAVGKTMLAERIAVEKHSPLWNLGAVQVGHDFATGTVAGTFGDDLFSTVTTELREGRRTIVFDALDEARLRAGEANFEGFLDGIADRFCRPRAKPALVLLGRQEAVDWAELWLGDKGVPTARYDIEYFDEETTKEFIERYLANLPADRIKATDDVRQSLAFVETRDAMLKRLGDCAPETPQLVIGYAPVLIVVSEYLNEGNPHGLAERVKRWQQQDPARLLAQVARELLEREHLQKTRDLLPKTLAPSNGFDAWEMLYTPDEQCLRMLAMECTHELGERPPRDLPARLRNDYEKAIAPWIEDHPFRGQQVFREYTYAWLFKQEDAESALRDAVHRRLTSPAANYLPSRLLAEFLLAMDGAEPAATAALKATDLGLLYESILAGCANGDVVRFTLASSDEGESAVGEFAWFDKQASKQTAGKPRRKLELTIQRAQEGIWFWRRLTRADLQIFGSVRLGSAESDFVLGPDVDVECDTFACNARSLRVIADTDDRAVRFNARVYEGDNIPAMVGHQKDRAHFGVAWEPMRHPWAPYRMTPVLPVKTTPELLDAYQKLRRILVRFRAEGYDDIARSMDLIDNPIVAGKGLAHQVLTYCLEKKLISAASRLYRLERRTMDSLGINWHDIQMRNLSPAIAAFLEEFLTRRH